ncbi:MAG TPA: hypothetical protein VFA94_05150 [Acidimicrobiales bacterium]|nr:hypothetical protein [Acidimicrobiales bacterium]
MVALDIAVQTALAVLAADGRVVVILSGAGAADAVDEWRAEGYEVRPVELAES